MSLQRLQGIKSIPEKTNGIPEYAAAGKCFQAPFTYQVLYKTQSIPRQRKVTQMAETWFFKLLFSTDFMYKMITQFILNLCARTILRLMEVTC